MMKAGYGCYRGRWLRNHFRMMLIHISLLHENKLKIHWDEDKGFFGSEFIIFMEGQDDVVNATIDFLQQK